jgi:RND family efflux transporter MFP subunit
MVTLAALVALTGCGGDETPAAGAADSVATANALVLAPSDLATAAMRPMGAAVMVSGNLDPADVVQVRAQVPGQVEGVRVDRGTAVRRGAVLAVIEAAGIRGQAAAARAQVAVAQQRLEASKRLFEAGAISSIEYKSAEAGYEAARAAADAAAESAGRATITSPINGVVSARFVSGGEAVNPGQPLFTVVDATELELAGRIGVADAARVRAGQAVTFTLDAFPGQSFRGRVARVDPTADLNTRQVGVYMRMPNVGGRIVGGQFARGRIETGTARNAIAIPEAAVFARSGEAGSVFVVTGNRIARRPVTLGARDAEAGVVAVVSGLNAGDRVLVSPSSEIADGTLVSIAADSVRAAPTGAAR